MSTILKKFTTWQFIGFIMGCLGGSIAGQFRSILAGPVLESYGATPALFGIIFMIGPILGVVLPPFIGMWSDRINTPFGRRRPWLLFAAISGFIAYMLFPNLAIVTSWFHLPFGAALLLAAGCIWILDVGFNISNGPYRALIPDNMPPEQHTIANSWMSMASGLGMVIGAGIIPFAKWAFNYTITPPTAFAVGSIALIFGMLITCFTIKETGCCQEEFSAEADTKKKELDTSFVQSVKDFFSSKEVSNCVLWRVSRGRVWLL